MRTAILILALVLTNYASAEAQQPLSSTADLGSRLSSGDTIFVTDGVGRETRGVFAKVSDSGLTLLEAGVLRDIPSTDIREIARQGDSVKNGFLIGAVFGGVVTGISSVSCSEFDPYCNPAILIPTGVLTYGGIGALVDHFIKGRTVVFRVANTGLQLRPGVSVGQGRMSAWIVISTLQEDSPH